MERQRKVIFFDLDGTLVDYESDARHAYGKARDHAIKKYPHAAKFLTGETFKRARDATYIQYGDTGIPLADWYRECMRIVLESVEVFDIELARHMGKIYGTFRNTTLTVFDDALEVVPRLAGRYRLGLITNGSSRLPQNAITDCFTYSVYAREVGYEKPAPEIFHAAATTAGCSSSEIVVVGDGQHTDIIGAKNAGMEMVWINRMRVELLQGIPKPDHEIHDLREILRITPV